MKAGELANAVRRALNKFDEWNDATGAAPPHTSLYYELQGVVEDAVHCGIQASLGVRTLLPSERDDGQAGMRYWMCECCCSLLVTGPNDSAVDYHCPQCKKAECDHGGKYGEVDAETFAKEAKLRPLVEKREDDHVRLHP